jgi:hypothetical protein
VSQLKTTVHVIKTANFLKTRFFPPKRKSPHPIVVIAALVMLKEISSYPFDIISRYDYSASS